jgi:hypothetical protein
MRNDPGFRHVQPVWAAKIDAKSGGAGARMGARHTEPPMPAPTSNALASRRAPAWRLLLARILGRQA